MAAAPVASWEAGIRGAELFERRTMTAEALRADYADWWRHWEKDRAAARPEGHHPPVSVPGHVGTRRTGSAQDFTVGATPWRLRLAEVEVEGAERALWPRFLLDDGSPAT
jgi:hypothetical protein